MSIKVTIKKIICYAALVVASLIVGVIIEKNSADTRPISTSSNLEEINDVDVPLKDLEEIDDADIPLNNNGFDFSRIGTINDWKLAMEKSGAIYIDPNSGLGSKDGIEIKFNLKND